MCKQCYGLENECRGCRVGVRERERVCVRERVGVRVVGVRVVGVRVNRFEMNECEYW